MARGGTDWAKPSAAISSTGTRVRDRNRIAPPTAHHRKNLAAAMDTHYVLVTKKRAGWRKLASSDEEENSSSCECNLKRRAATQTKEPLTCTALKTIIRMDTGDCGVGEMEG